MICLTCKTQLEGPPPLECHGCATLHESRPPIVGINHFSQLLCALDLLADAELDPESFETVFYNFVDQLEALEEKWSFRESPLAPRLAPSLAEKFGPQIGQFDRALQLGFQGLELVEAILSGESDDFGTAEECLVGFFRGICSASASLLDNLEQLKGKKSGGMLFNLPSV